MQAQYEKAWERYKQHLDDLKAQAIPVSVPKEVHGWEHGKLLMNGVHFRIEGELTLGISPPDYYSIIAVPLTLQTDRELTVPGKASDSENPDDELIAFASELSLFSIPEHYSNLDKPAPVEGDVVTMWMDVVDIVEKHNEKQLDSQCDDAVQELSDKFKITRKSPTNEQ